MKYRCVATSVAGFVQQMAVGYIAKGYYFYVTGTIPKQKNPAKTDEKIIRQYDLALSKWTRSRRKRHGGANVQYLRFDRFFVIIATDGQHSFFEAEAGQIHDVRRRPILFRGYSIGCRPARGGGEYHASVRINREVYKELKTTVGKMALEMTEGELMRILGSLPFEPYAPVREQIRGLLRFANRCRITAGLEPLPFRILIRGRSSLRPFATSKPSSETVTGNAFDNFDEADA